MSHEDYHSTQNAQAQPLTAMKQAFKQAAELLPDSNQSLAVLGLGGMGLGTVLAITAGNGDEVRAAGVNKFTPQYQCMAEANGLPKDGDGDDANPDVFTYNNRGENTLRNGQKVVIAYLRDKRVATWANQSCDELGSRTITAQLDVADNKGKLKPDKPDSNKVTVVTNSNDQIFPTRVEFRLKQAYTCKPDKVIPGHRPRKQVRDIGVTTRETGKYDGWRRSVRVTRKSDRIGIKPC